MVVATRLPWDRCDSMDDPEGVSPNRSHNSVRVAYQTCSAPQGCRRAPTLGMKAGAALLLHGGESHSGEIGYPFIQSQ